MHQPPVTLWRAILGFILFLLSTWKKSSLVFEGCLIHLDLQDVFHFDSLTLFSLGGGGGVGGKFTPCSRFFF